MDKHVNDLQVCTICKVEQPLENYYKSSKRKTGYSNTCKQCSLIYVKKHNASAEGKEKNTAWRHVAKSKRLSQGFCSKCDRERMSQDALFCKWHCVQHACGSRLGKADKLTVQLLLDRLESNPICPYTGKTLVLGINTHLDHILPVSRFPEFKSQVLNVEWISAKANLSKGDMTKDEFIAFCKLVVKFADSQ